jgi:hypothetical protein
VNGEAARGGRRDTQKDPIGRIPLRTSGVLLNSGLLGVAPTTLVAHDGAEALDVFSVIGPVDDMPDGLSLLYIEEHLTDRAQSSHRRR